MPTRTTPSSWRRRLLAAIGAGSVALVTGCGSGSTSTGHGADHGGTSPSARTSGTPDGQHHGAAGKGLLATDGGYTLKPSTTSLAVGEQTLRFQVLDPRGRPQTDYAVDQTQRMHLYLVRLDLTGYQHLHPTLSDGTWSVRTEITAPGPYRMYTDFIPKDSAGKEHPLVLSTVLTAPGRYAPETLPAASATTTAGGLTATMVGTVTSGTASRVSFRITAGDEPVSDLEPYLDSFAHLTALRAEDLAYEHVHPELQASAGQRGGPELPFSVELPEGGSWRLFLQVQRAGTLHLLPLTVRVA